MDRVLMLKNDIEFKLIKKYINLELIKEKSKKKIFL